MQTSLDLQLAYESPTKILQRHGPCPCGCGGKNSLHAKTIERRVVGIFPVMEEPDSTKSTTVIARGQYIIGNDFSQCELIASVINGELVGQSWWQKAGI